jgi:signal transduction histidine kinase/DNA-binding LacI/PurR family transcriptional regulator
MTSPRERAAGAPRSGSGGRSRPRPVIGMVMPNVVDLHGDQWLGAVEAAAAQQCDLICFCGGILDDPILGPQANVIYDLVTAETIDALVVWTGALAPHVGQEGIEKFRRRFAGLPVVAVEQPLTDAPVVRMENRRGMCEVVSHLIEVHGCERIAFIRGPATVDAAHERYQGYLDALARYGLPVDPALVSAHLQTWSPIEAAAWVADLLRSEVPDAIAATNDDLATGAIFAVESAGLEGIAIVGYDDWPNFRTNDLGFARGADDDDAIRRQVAVSVSTVSLTTVRAPFQELGRCAVDVALALLRGTPAPEASMVPTELVIRRSCGCLPAVSTPVPAGNGDVTAQLRQALPDPSVVLPADWAERLVAALLGEMRGQSDGAFARLLDDFVQRCLRSTDAALDWSRALSVLRRLIGAARDPAEAERGEMAWERAYLLLTDTSERQHWRYMRALVEKRNQLLREVGHQLITATDVAGLVQLLPAQLSRVGIAGCYLALYEPAVGNGAAPQSRLILAYENEVRTWIAPDRVVFRSAQLVPDGRLQRASPYSLVVAPLYFKDEQLGFVLFELGPKIGWVYSALREQLSSALHRLFMVERERSALAALEEIHRREERQRLASDLHDSVSQALFSMTLQTRALELAVRRQGGEVDGRVQRGLAELRELTQGALAEMRALIFQLRPEVLHEDGLVTTLRRLAAAVTAQEGFEVTVQASTDHVPLDEQTELELFRVVREAVHNGVKHANPARIEIRLYEPDDAAGMLVVEVADDGVGFNPDDPHPGHLGLSTMRERTERIGGQFTIDSSPHGSTTVRAVLPYRTPHPYRAASA